MQVEVDVKCMQTNFGGHGLSSFGDFAPFHLPSKTAKISFQLMDYSPWGSENGISSKNLRKYRLTLPLSLPPFPSSLDHSISSFPPPPSLSSFSIRFWY